MMQKTLIVLLMASSVALWSLLATSDRDSDSAVARVRAEDIDFTDQYLTLANYLDQFDHGMAWGDTARYTLAEILVLTVEASKRGCMNWAACDRRIDGILGRCKAETGKRDGVIAEQDRRIERVERDVEILSRCGIREK